MQRIFDVENEKDMQDLWDILPDDIEKLSPIMGIRVRIYANEGYCSNETNLLAINWHDKTEITRPIQEATEQDIGKLCMFWDNKEEIHYGKLAEIINQGKMTVYSLEDIRYYYHARRLTKQEIEELC